MTREEAIAAVKNHSSNKVKFAIIDIDGILRGKYIHKDKFMDQINGDFGFCDVVYGWDSSDALYHQSGITGWDTGFPDGKAKIDLDTFRQVPWDEDVPFFLADYAAGSPSKPVCPRSLLKQIIAKAESKGLFAQFAIEYEWFNFQSNSAEKEITPKPISEGMFGYSLTRLAHATHYVNDIFDLCGSFDVQIEGMHTETGPGVLETAIQKDTILRAADKGALFKMAVKEIANQYDIIPSFMAKWNEKLPGCSGHLHQSILDQNGNNLFFDPKDEQHMSPMMKSYLAGQLHCLPYLMPFFAPTVNSYKRLVEGAWAPTTVTWGLDNRTVALRVLNDTASSTRIEHRVAGADVNPYLCMAAGLASGLYGIENNLKLETPAISGNAYANKRVKRLPSNLNEATQAMKKSKLAKDLLGEEFIQHFAMTREHEWNEYLKTVSDWELKRYFEII
ncbi:glutamine synthetase family protein [Reichenbachiella agarivorans]|uniref:Glutamine synthetase family protein n=1 Tax=Reichenbachiella agarivorans TaxID=2979464 RepID=A0ABY6CUF2_9BACT|nr:glutamine synthetase family protein [Reichenbachiella agarivorans]UXP32983.1 glutamine synthetase family protein [Reichenbachiella agarivorans]